MRHCILHKWRLYKWEYYVDISYGYKVPSTEYWLSCDKCGSMKDGFFYSSRPTEEMLVQKFRGWSKFSKQGK